MSDLLSESKRGVQHRVNRAGVRFAHRVALAVNNSQDAAIFKAPPRRIRCGDLINRAVQENKCEVFTPAQYSGGKFTVPRKFLLCVHAILSIRKFHKTMDKLSGRVVCYLRMKSIIRKNEILPSHLDPEQFESIFWHIREYPEQPQSKRVEQVLKLLSSLSDDLSTLGKAQALTRLRNALRRYQWVSFVSPTSEGLWVSRGIADRVNLSEDDVWEYEAVRNLLDLVPYLGKRPRIRRCAECQEWFFAARRSDQQWCDRNCRQRHYDSAPEMRKKKKLYMQEYREGQKERVERENIRVAFRGRVKHGADTGSKRSAKKSLR